MKVCAILVVIKTNLGTKLWTAGLTISLPACVASCKNFLSAQSSSWRIPGTVFSHEPHMPLPPYQVQLVESKTKLLVFNTKESLQHTTAYLSLLINTLSPRMKPLMLVLFDLIPARWLTSLTDYLPTGRLCMLSYIVAWLRLHGAQLRPGSFSWPSCWPLCSVSAHLTSQMPAFSVQETGMVDQGLVHFTKRASTRILSEIAISASALHKCSERH